MEVPRAHRARCERDGEKIACASPISPACEGVTFLDDPETVLANGHRSDASRSPRESPKARPAEGEERPEGAAEGEGAEGCGRARHRRGIDACGCRGAGANGPRRSTCSWSDSAIPGASTRGNRHNVGWMVVEELARRHGGVVAGEVRRPARGDPPRRAPGRAARTGDVHERVGPVGETPRRGSSRSSRTRSSSCTTRATSSLGRLQARKGGGLGGPQRAALDRAAARNAGLPPAARRRRSSRSRRPPVARGLRPVGLRAARRRGVDRVARGRRDRDPRRLRSRARTGPVQLTLG